MDDLAQTTEFEEPVADAILGTEDLEIREVPVPEWKTTIWIHQLEAVECVQLTDMLGRPQFKEDGIFITLIYCARDREGNRIFTMEHLPALKKKSFKVLNRLQTIALTLNSLTPRARAEVKNESSGAPAVASPTASH